MCFCSSEIWSFFSSTLEVDLERVVRRDVFVDWRSEYSECEIWILEDIDFIMRS